MSLTDSSSASPKTWAIIIWALFLASVFSLAFTEIVGVIVAYVKRDDLAGTPYESHATSAIRTFWITLIGVALSIPLSVVGIGVVTLIALGLWSLFRIIRGLIRAIDGRPIDHPTGWL